ncbi:unnamed protein product [Euphydryas editha]|uniref:Uncharacterized protein n=1 Tax=Euphydryas editha TaxID=104508 RepID=A0AAU9TST7_EUPED|nr:unnamed protein product [Euphydryas editha]
MDHWIIYSQNYEVMTYKCGNDLSKTAISGTDLLTIDSDCEVLLGDLHLSYVQHIIEREEYKITPIIQLPEIHYRNTSIFPPIDIKGINLDDVKHLSTVLNKKVLVKVKVK